MSYSRIFPMDPIEMPLTIFRNDNPWQKKFIAGQNQHGRWIDFPNEAKARMQVRIRDGAPGTPLLEAVMEPYGGLLIARISRASLEALPDFGEVGSSTILRYDVLVDIPDIGENVAFFGDVTLYHGVTR